MITVEGVITGWTVTAASGELALSRMDLQTLLRTNMTDPRLPRVVRQLTQTRRLVETVISQINEN